MFVLKQTANVRHPTRDNVSTTVERASLPAAQPVVGCVKNPPRLLHQVWADSGFEDGAAKRRICLSPFNRLRTFEFNRFYIQYLPASRYYTLPFGSWLLHHLTQPCGSISQQDAIGDIANIAFDLYAKCGLVLPKAVRFLPCGSHLYVTHLTYA